MSVVACRVTGNGFTIAADSISVRGWTQTKEQTSLSKLFVVDGLVVGSAGYASEITLMQLYCTGHRPTAATEAAMLEFLTEFADWKNSKTGDRELYNEYIIGFQSKAFHISGWCISRIRTYEAIGAGMDFALAAMYFDKTAVGAVMAAVELSVFCESPVIRVSSLDGEVSSVTVVDTSDIKAAL